MDNSQRHRRIERHFTNIPLSVFKGWRIQGVFKGWGYDPMSRSFPAKYGEYVHEDSHKSRSKELRNKLMREEDAFDAARVNCPLNS